MVHNESLRNKKEKGGEKKDGRSLSQVISIESANGGEGGRGKKKKKNANKNRQTG